MLEEEPSALGNKYRSLFKNQTLKLLDTDKALWPCLCSTPAPPALPVLPKVIHKSRDLLATPQHQEGLGKAAELPR